MPASLISNVFEIASFRASGALSKTNLGDYLGIFPNMGEGEVFSIPKICKLKVFLAVQNSSIGDLVTN